MSNFFRTVRNSSELQVKCSDRSCSTFKVRNSPLLLLQCFVPGLPGLCESFRPNLAKKSAIFGICVLLPFYYQILAKNGAKSQKWCQIAIKNLGQIFKSPTIFLPNFFWLKVSKIGRFSAFLRQKRSIFLKQVDIFKKSAFCRPGLPK